MEEEKKSNNTWLAFIAGAVAGGVIGYLVASGKGKELWSELKQKANELGDEFSELKDLFAEEDSDKPDESRTHGNQG